MTETRSGLLDEGEHLLAEMKTLQQEGPTTSTRAEAAQRIETRLGEVLDRVMSRWRYADLTAAEQLRAQMMLVSMNGLLETP
jgi:hypothetical protein